MDITLSKNKIFSNKYVNGETVNYTAMFMVFALAFLVVKQVLKLGFAVPSGIALLVSFIVSLIAMFFAEKKFVFTHTDNNNIAKQIIMYFLSCVISFGLYQFLDFVFVNLLKLSDSTVYLATGVAIFFYKYYFDRLLVFEVNTEAKDNNKGRLYKLFFNNRFIILSMLLATVGILFIFMIFTLYPFGDKTVLRMDLYHQYGPLFVEFYDRIIEHKSFLYSWQSGGGSSFLGNYFNYLSSPLSLIILLFSKKQIGYAITTLVAVKGVLSAGTFSYFIKKSLKSHSYASSSFGVFYAFCGYFLAYYWNIMWIDGMIFLPLIALGIERIINKDKPVLYIVSLCLMFYSSYYIGYMMCIFSILYFIVYYFSNHSATDKLKNINKKSFISNLINNKFINRGVLFAVSSILCAGICACFLIPVYFILQQCSATSDSFPSMFESYFNLINLISSHMAGLETTIRSSGDDVLPNIYCGMLSVILLPLYVMNKEINLKEKLLYILLILFFVFSFDNNYMNFIWHAFHFPNDLPYRFSFMYSFIILIVAYKSLQKIKAIRYQDIAVVGMIWILIALYFQANPTNKISEPSVYITLAFVIIWTGVLLLIKKGIMSKAIIGLTIIAMTFCEVIVANSNSYLFTQNNKEYVADYDDYKEAIDYTYEADKEFYRSELCYLNTRMDPCLYNYNGISTFSSMAYKDYSGTQYSLGMFGNRINSYTYNTQTPIYNMMFSIKYLMHKDTKVAPSSEYYEKYYSTGNYNVDVYENKFWLPIAFETSTDIKDWIVAEGNPFEIQEDFVNLATGLYDIFNEVDFLETNGENVECDNVVSNGSYNFSKQTSEDYASISIKLTPRQTGNVYIYVTSPAIDNLNYYWGDEDSLYQNIDEPYILDLGVHNEGEEIRIELDCSSLDTGSYFDIYAYTINNSNFAEAYDKLKANSLNVTSYSDTRIEGTINASYNGYLYTSIPSDEGWSIYIDGKEQNTFDIGDSMLATSITKGEHSVVMKYSPKGFKYGVVISVASWCCVAAYFIIRKIFKKKFVENQ